MDASLSVETDPERAELAADDLLDCPSPKPDATYGDLWAAQYPALDGHSGRPTIRQIVIAGIRNERAQRRAGSLTALLKSTFERAHARHLNAWEAEQGASSYDLDQPPEVRQRARERENHGRALGDDIRAQAVEESAASMPVDLDGPRPGEGFGAYLRRTRGGNDGTEDPEGSKREAQA